MFTTLWLKNGDLTHCSGWFKKIMLCTMLGAEAQSFKVFTFLKVRSSGEGVTSQTDDPETGEKFCSACPNPTQLPSLNNTQFSSMFLQCQWHGTIMETMVSCYVNEVHKGWDSSTSLPIVSSFMHTKRRLEAFQFETSNSFP